MRFLLFSRSPGIEDSGLLTRLKIFGRNKSEKK